MILVDTSVWIDHFRRRIAALERALSRDAVTIHPFVTGELACGTLRHRARTLADLSELPPVTRATDDEVLALIERQQLSGRGIGLIDLHLLASTLLTPETRLWTLDRRLARLAHEFAVAYRPDDRPR